MKIVNLRKESNADQANDNKVVFLSISWVNHAFDTIFSGVSN